MKTAIKNAIREVAIDAITELAKQIRDTEWTITVRANARSACSSAPVSESTES